MIISCAPQNVFAWLTESELMGQPAKDPLEDENENENENENEQDKEDKDADDEPAVIREPDE